MKTRVPSILSPALLIMQTSVSAGFQTPPVIVASVAKTCNNQKTIHRINACSPVMQQHHQREHQQVALLLSIQKSTMGRKELHSKELRPKFRLLGGSIAAAFAFATVMTRAIPARAAAAAIVMPMAGTDSGVILPLLTSSISSPFKINRRGVITLAFSTLALLATMVVFVRTIGDEYVPMKHVPRLFGRSVEDFNGEISDLDLGLPKEIDWGTYTHSMIEPLTEKKTKKKVANATKGKRFPLNVLNFYERIKAKDEVDRDANESMLEKATQFFLEQKYKLHHHPVHVSHSRYEVPTYLQTLAVNVLERHDVPKGYLDTLSTAKFSTWNVYQHRLDEVNPASEVDELKQGVSNLQDLMQMEQSMYHTSNHVLKLAIDAHHDEMQHVSTHDQLKEFDERLSIHEELKAFDKKAMEYEEIVRNGEAAAMNKVVVPGSEEDCKATNFPV